MHLQHRRFREFVELNSQIKQNMKGHHLRDVLPQMPDKPSKQFTDHRDPAFIQDRCFKLERFVVAMTSIPHVANMVCMKAFLGIMDQVYRASELACMCNFLLLDVHTRYCCSLQPKQISVCARCCYKAYSTPFNAIQVREYSLTFHVPTLGMSLLPTERQVQFIAACFCVIFQIRFH